MVDWDIGPDGTIFLIEKEERLLGGHLAYFVYRFHTYLAARQVWQGPPIFCDIIRSCRLGGPLGNMGEWKGCLYEEKKENEAAR
ncbi:MAG: hypothetical protein E6230_26760 [Paenibacillus dendritiformis]|uniref:hypothetical protein n=1 Tax=Paenibacillus dendritiformis TaxID=130049 RepID=UPI00143D500D|nr:hypothetical protein [Paenibacillus dendritiformis]MDU5145776.1 hypothetical protein [Paenibacillus dendritiformis]NKI24420.1 hypothetical protein [Paenibacillus dendritiformis]NRG00590.1 hypothetical protein [Paenibacillus dendritiformis]GIO73072.1 hypothetical protein J27TS7_25860 [Paenibacillus dendritiformis]